jgi:hypothetical protein
MKKFRDIVKNNELPDGDVAIVSEYIQRYVSGGLIYFDDERHLDENHVENCVFALNEFFLLLSGAKNLFNQNRDKFGETLFRCKDEIEQHFNKYHRFYDELSVGKSLNEFFVQTWVLYGIVDIVVERLGETYTEEASKVMEFMVLVLKDMEMIVKKG